MFSESLMNYFVEGFLFVFTKIRFPTIIPQSKFKIIWDFLILCLCIVHFYITITCICLEYNFGGGNAFVAFYKTWVQSFLWVFILDLFLKFNSGYFLNGEQILDKKKIVENYLKSEFLFDMCGILSVCLESIGDFLYLYEFLFKVLFLFKYPILNKLLQNFEEILNFDQKIEALISLFKLSVKMLFLAHIIACSWLTIGHCGKKLNNWIEMKGITNESMAVQYEVSLYWAFVTIATIGYGDITPQNEYEYLFSIGVIVSGSMFFGYSMTCISQIFKELEKDEITQK